MPLKKLFLTLVLPLLWFTVANAQPATPPSAYQPTININYVREWTPTAPISDASIVPTRVVEEVKTSTAYMDGLGRSLQSVIKQASPTKKDLVSATVYDELGRETYKYLPFVSSTTSGGTEITDNGSFKLNPFQQQAAFMNVQYGTQGEQYFYGQTDFDNSPLNRPIKAFDPGNSWVGSRASTTSAEKSVQGLYQFNTTADALIIWTIGSQQGLVPISSGLYPAGEVAKSVTINENGKKMVLFSDKEGKLLLKKMQIANSVTDGHTGWLCTYYVYDDFNQLRFVIPPKAIEAYLGGSSLSALSDELCFRYEYDYRHRMIIKKVPGAAEFWMVYDSRERLVMTQDGNLRTNGKWLITVYDVLNRPIQTGLLTDASTTFAAHQSNAEISSSYPLTTTNFELLTQNYYDDYSWVAASSTTLSSTIDATNLTNSNYFITTYNTTPYFALPLTPNYAVKGMQTGSKVKVLGTTNQFLYSVGFYDEKGRQIQTQNINISGGKDINTTQYDFSGKSLRNLLQHTMVTPPFGGNGGATQTHTVLTKTEYDHLGRVMFVRKQITSIVGGQTIIIPEKTILQNSYDEQSQLKVKKIGNLPNSVIPLESLSYDYNISGWLLGINRGFINGNPANANNYFGFELAYDKPTGSIPGKTYAATQYNGNIAGIEWKSRGDAVNRQYDYTYDNINRLLKADFKQVNPIDNSFNNNLVNYNVVMGDGSLLPDGSIDYDKAYDANGNIKQMQKWGLRINTSNQIDNLHYTYFTNSNKLQNIIDYYDDAVTKLGDFKTSTSHTQYGPKSTIRSDAAYNASASGISDYGYDLNGNLITDRNKNLIGNIGINQNSVGGAINYNFLDLPTSISVNNKGNITYTYNADGIKLQKTTVESNGTVVYMGTSYPTQITTTTKYIDEFVYESKSYSNSAIPPAAIQTYTDLLQFIAHEEGRMRFKKAITNPANSIVIAPATFAFDYTIKDHLGNIRMVLTDEYQLDHYPTATLEANAVVQEQTYYDINTDYVVPSPVNAPTYINDNGTNNPNTFGTPAANSQKIYKLNAATNRSGLNMVLKVMAGDKIDILAKSYYQYAGGTITNTNFSVTDLLTSFLGTANGVNAAAQHGGTQPILSNNTNGTVTPVNNFLNNPGNTNASNNVKAGLCYILFDEQFNYVVGNFDAVNNNSSGGLKSHLLQNIPVAKNGYIYIYASNESNIDVFFDNIEVGHTRSQIIEETHYYPFGLIMSGISSKAAGKLENRYKFNGGTELNNDLDIGLYETEFRNYDPQIGRFLQIDALADNSDSFSPFTFANDNPILVNDPLGLESNIAFPRRHKKVITLPSVVVISHLKPKTKPQPNKTATSEPSKPKQSTLAKIVDEGINFVPFAGSGRDIYRGIRDGDGWQVAGGIVGLAFDFFTFGGSTILKGAAKTIIKEAAEVFTKEVVAEGIMGVVKKEAKEGVYNIVTKEGVRYIGHSKKILKRVISHFYKSGKLGIKNLTRDLENEVFHYMKGSSPLEREVYEQYLINNAGGVDALFNKINPMGGRMDQYEKLIESVIKKFNLPR